MRPFGEHISAHIVEDVWVVVVTTLHSRHDHVYEFHPDGSVWVDRLPANGCYVGDVFHGARSVEQALNAV